jgi:hypothetical protein
MSQSNTSTRDQVFGGAVRAQIKAINSANEEFWSRNKASAKTKDSALRSNEPFDNGPQIHTENSINIRRTK